MKLTNEVKKDFRDSLSYMSAREFYKFIEGLDKDIIIVRMKCNIESFDTGSYIFAKLAKPCIDLKNDCVDDYDFGYLIMKWDQNGKLIKSKKNFPWANCQK